MSPISAPTPVLVYDDRCAVCRQLAALVRGAVSPARLDIVPCGSAIQKKLAPLVSEQRCRQHLTYIRETGEIVEDKAAAEALVELAPSLHGHRLLAGTRARKLATFAYRIAEFVRSFTARPR